MLLRYGTKYAFGTSSWRQLR